MKAWIKVIWWLLRGGDPPKEIEWNPKN